jgi:hypothetical protein
VQLDAGKMVKRYLVGPEKYVLRELQAGLAVGRLCASKPDERTQKAGEVVEDETEIVACAAEQGIDGVADAAGEEVAAEPPVVLHVTDGQLDRAAALELASHGRGGATALAGDEGCAVAQTMAAIAAVDVAAGGR